MKPRHLVILMIFLIPTVLAFAAETASAEADAIAWGAMVGGLCGGVALFLFGMDQMADALRAAAGESLKTLLAKLTKNRLMGAITGAIVTAVIQSSSVTTVLVVGFVSAGVMTLAQSVGIIMGANIGSTFTGQIIAFKVDQAALPMIAIGFAFLFVARRDRLKHIGAMIMGLGLIFYGMSIMSEAMYPLRSWDPFLEIMESMRRPFLGILVGAGFTAIVQSSAATAGIVIIMASQGVLTLEAGIAITLGANIGTCVTALLATIGKSREALRAAAVHILFNIVGVLIWIFIIPMLADIATAVSPVHDNLEGNARIAAEAPRQLANANTIFNTINTLLFLPLAGYFAVLATRFFPDVEGPEEPGLVAPKFLHEEALALPSVALENVRREIGEMGAIVLQMFDRVLTVITESDSEGLKQVAKMDDSVDLLHRRILEYLAKLRQENLSEDERQTMTALLAAVTYVESAGDVIETNLVSTGRSVIDKKLRASEKARGLIRGLQRDVQTALEAAIDSVAHSDPGRASDALALRDDIRSHLSELMEHQVQRFEDGDELHLSNVRVETEIMEALKRLYSFAKRLARIAHDEASVPAPDG